MLNPGPRNPVGRMPVASSMASSAVASFRFDLFVVVKVQPWFVMKRVIADLMPRRNNGCEAIAVLFLHGILTDDKDSYLRLVLVEKFEKAWNHHIQVAWIAIPTRFSVGLHVRPLIIKVE